MRFGYTYKWLWLAVFCLALGGAFAFLVAMSRVPGFSHFFPRGYFYHALVGHVIFAILLWLLSFAVVLWSMYFKRPALNFSWKLSLAGVLILTIEILCGKSAAVMNNYVPTITDPIFFAGLGLFFVGFAINAFSCARGALRSLLDDDPIKCALSTSVLIALVMVVSMAISALVSAAFLSGGRESMAPAIYFERLYWTPGHIQQALNASLLVSAWYCLKARLLPTAPLSRLLKGANLALLLSALLLFIITLFIDPLSKTSRAASEAVYAIGIGVPVFIHMINVVGGLKRDFSLIAYSSLVLSIIVYAFGVLIAYSGLGDDLRVPAHYHGAVTGLTLALMGLSYYILNDSGKAPERRPEGLLRVQPLLYGAGMILVITGLFVSGLLGAPRKTFGAGFTEDPLALASLGVMGLGTLMAVAGGGIFVYYTARGLIRKTSRQDGRTGRK